MSQFNVCEDRDREAATGFIIYCDKEVRAVCIDYDTEKSEKSRDIYRESSGKSSGMPLPLLQPDIQHPSSPSSRSPCPRIVHAPALQGRAIY